MCVCVCACLSVYVRMCVLLRSTDTFLGGGGGDSYVLYTHSSRDRVVVMMPIARMEGMSWNAVLSPRNLLNCVSLSAGNGIRPVVESGTTMTFEGRWKSNKRSRGLVRMW